ncbi:MAG: hypothetical protein ACP5RZ_06445, partial [Thermoplasmata archaeon]
NLKILDIGCDRELTLLQYLDYKGYQVLEYRGIDQDFDITLYTFNKRETLYNVNHESADDWFINYLPFISFLKIDCEGCEDKWISIMKRNGFPDIYMAIAIHDFSEKYEFNRNVLEHRGFKKAYVTPDKREILYIKKPVKK